MAKYVTFFSYTAEAAARMVADPEDRAEAARTVVEGVGGRLEGLYWMFGDHDGLVIYDVPDATIAAAVAIAVAASGRMKSMKTVQLLDAGEIQGALESAKAIATTYKPPGGRGPWHEGYDELG